MAGCVHPKWQVVGMWTRDSGERIRKMRFWLAVTLVLLGISGSGWAQQFKVKSTPERAPKQSAPIAQLPNKATASAANAKALQAAEKDGAKAPASPKSGGTKT